MAVHKEIIGDCTLYLGDCREVLPTLEPVDAVVTDPPYAISVAGSTQRRRDGSRRLDFFAGDDDWQTMTALVLDVWGRCLDLLPSSGTAYAYCGHRQFGPLIETAEDRGFQTRFLVWTKPCPPPAMKGNGYRAAAELCVYAYGAGRTFEGVQAPSVIVADTFRHGQPGKVDHPTQKPVGTIHPLVENSTRIGDTVLDPFMGSGTTGVVCATLGRSFIGCEKEEKFFDTACRRIEEAYRQPRLFAEPEPKPVQSSMFEVQK